MVTLYTDPRMLEHNPPARHPERPERLAAILRQLDRTGLAKSCRSGIVRPATDDELLRVHSPGYLKAIEAFGNGGGGQVEADTHLSSGSILAAKLATGAVIAAIDGVVSGRSSTKAVCLVRPPGHHARPDSAMGFCLYASIAVAAADAVERLGIERILIVDWDVHHGNGTQEIFYESPHVGFLSIHRYPFYPGSGAANETGSGAGLGRIRNVPIAHGTSRKEYLAAFRSNLESMADRIRPELILLSAGFDAHALDPVGDLGLEVEDFEAMTGDVLGVANLQSGGRIVSVLEGGYNVPILAGCVEAHIRALKVES